MGLYEHFPYTNFHELNLDWLLLQVKKLREDLNALAGDLDPDAIKQAIYDYLHDHPDIFPFVTPQMFGAVADGTADDTEAIQDAIDAGIDVYFPTDHGEVYKVTQTIDIKAPCKKLYGAGSARGTANAGVIKREYATVGETGQAAAMFRIGAGNQGVHINNLRFILGTEGGANNSGVALDAETFTFTDKDIYITSCSFVDASEAIRFYGRGLSVFDCSFGSCSVAAVINGDTASDTYETRAIRFERTRFHAMTGDFAVKVMSGHSYGFRMVDCLADRWLHGLIYAAQQANNWLISGNTAQQVYRASGADVLIRLEGGADNCAISNNIFRSTETGNGRISHHIYISGPVTGCRISGNIIDGSHLSPIRISGSGATAGVVIEGNEIQQVADAANTQYAAIQINNASQVGYVIANNSLAGRQGSVNRLLSGSNVGALKYSTISGNVCGAIPAAAYDAASCQVTGNVVTLPM